MSSMKCLVYVWSVWCVLLVTEVDSTDLEFPPDFIRDHRCRRNDPEIEKCMMKALEDLRPYLNKGIPQLHIPALEPFYIPELTMPKQRGHSKASITNLRAYGFSDFQLKFKLGVDILTSNVYIEVPRIDFEFDYDVDIKALAPIRGYGSVRGNLTSIKADAISRARLEPEQDGDRIKVDEMNVKFGLKNFSVDIVNMYRGNSIITNNTAKVINSNSKHLIKNALPFANRFVSAQLPLYMNKITDNFLYGDLFIDD